MVEHPQENLVTGMVESLQSDCLPALTSFQPQNCPREITMAVKHKTVFSPKMHRYALRGL